MRKCNLCLKQNNHKVHLCDTSLLWICITSPIFPMNEVAAAFHNESSTSASVSLTFTDNLGETLIGFGQSSWLINPATLTFHWHITLDLSKIPSSMATFVQRASWVWGGGGHLKINRKTPVSFTILGVFCTHEQKEYGKLWEMESTPILNTLVLLLF